MFLVTSPGPPRGSDWHPSYPQNTGSAPGLVRTLAFPGFCRLQFGPQNVLMKHWASNTIVTCSGLVLEPLVTIRTSPVYPYILRLKTMQLPPMPFTVTTWEEIDPEVSPGEKGFSTTREFNVGELRVRSVEYSPGYLADHWCERGHVLYVLEGELISELKDGRRFRLTPGMSYQVSDAGDSPHRSSTKTGVKLFIVD